MLPKLWRRFRSAKPASMLLFTAGLTLLAGAGTGLWQRYDRTHQPPILPVAGQPLLTTVERPDETKPAADANYEVPAGQPRSIQLPTIGTEGFIQKVGLDKDNAVVAPSNVHYAGWYYPEAVPGDPGLSLIDGHVQGRYIEGIFNKLNMLSIGDRFTIELGDRSRRQFEVVRKESLDVPTAGQKMLARDPAIERQLNLITCDGVYDKTSQQYQKRLLVTAKAI